MSTAAVAVALDLVVSLLSRAAEISELIRTVNASGRTEFTPEEWAQITEKNESARQKLVEAIAAAKAREAAAAPPPAPAPVDPPAA